MQVLLLGEREESPGEFPNGTANGPPQRVLFPTQVEVILRTGFEQIQQFVFGVDKVFIAGEVVTPATLVPLAEIARMDDNQRGCVRAQCASRGKHPTVQHAQKKANICT